MEENGEDKRKPHRERHSGRKAEKKKTKKDHVQEQTDKQRNPKAFTFNSAVRAERRFRRTQDIQTKKQHVPVVDRTPLEPPPILVVVVGPPKVGKSTLIQCLVKTFTRQPLMAVKGPVTVVSGKKRRITLIECNNDINSMIDLAKVADLVLLLIDASFGFEMEIFEFLNICQVHGMPKVMGVLTHLDMLKQAKTLKRTKKVLKHRFWTEVYAGAKLFYLSGLLHGEYLRNEVKNLGRFISVMKFRPLTWQTTHSYLLADRIEDLTAPEVIRQNPKVDRTVSLYGFVRGIPLNKTSSIHIPGCGDSTISDVCFLPDPCPLPNRLKKRSLVDKERLIYAPFSGVGGIVYDKDAVYIELAGSHSHHNQVGGRDESERELVTSLLETKDTLDAKIAKSQLQIFSNTEPITAQDFQANMVRNDDRNMKEMSITNPNDGRNRRKVFFEIGDDDIELKSEPSADDDIETEPDEDEMINGSDSDTEEKVCETFTQSTSSDESDNEEIESEKDSSGTNDALLSVKRSKGKSKSSIMNDNVHNNQLGKDSNKTKNLVIDKDTSMKKKERKTKEDSIFQIEKRKEIMKRKKQKTPSTSESENDSDESDEEIDHPVHKKMKTSLSGEVDGTVRYHATQSEKDKEISKKISDALQKLQNPSSKKDSPAVFTDSAFSDDEGSESMEDSSQSGTDDESSDEESGTEIKSDHIDTDDDIDISIKEESNSNDENGDNDTTAVNWKANLAQKAADAFVERQTSTANLWKLVYGQDAEEEAKEENVDEEEVAGLFRVVSKKQEMKIQEKDSMNTLDSSKFIVPQLRNWSNEQVQEMIKDCFVTGKWKSSEDASELLRLDDVSGDDEDVFGDFEDLETGEKHSAKSRDQNKMKDENGSEADDDDDDEKVKNEKPMTKAELMQKKRKLKEKFDAEYDEKDGEGNSFYDELKKDASMQAELNRSQFSSLDDSVRVQLEGFRAGMYVRVELQQMPCELVTHFDPTYPLVLGGLQPGEENISYLKVRIKKHRWYKRILKTRDPLIISLGWRRFQTLAVYSKQEENLRHRMLKYTPEHVVCMAHLWGPITRPNTGFLAVQDVATKQAGFRIVATGSVVDCNKSTDVTKKLKLTGVPLKIYKKTAFIKGMFNSALEVAKFEGARIKTVSGIRGIIKKAVNKPEGAFRATFEDKIQLSDIVFCRTWYGVEIPKLYNPVTSLLLPPDQKNLWRGMKTVGQLKREKGLRSEPQSDSLYTPIERQPVAFKPLVIPKKLQKELPYKDKPKVLTLQKKKEKVAVVRDIQESKVASMMRKLKTIYNQKQKEERRAKVQRLNTFKKKIEAEEARKLQRQRKMKKDVFRTLSKTEAKKPKF